MSNIEEDIKQLEDLKKDRLSFVTGDKEHDEIYLKDVQAIEIVLGNLEALADMQRTADKELENARRINEEHKRDKVKELEEELYSANKIINEYLDGIPKQKVKDVLQNNRNEIFSFTYVDDEQFKPYTMQIDRINKIEKELLEEGE